MCLVHTVLGGKCGCCIASPGVTQYTYMFDVAMCFANEMVC
jgi:hypothetical protein